MKEMAGKLAADLITIIALFIIMAIWSLIAMMVVKIGMAVGGWYLRRNPQWLAEFDRQIELREEKRAAQAQDGK